MRSFSLIGFNKRIFYGFSSCSTAYKNISEAVQSASDLSDNAREMAEQSENDLYPKDDESIIEKSTKSLKKSQKIHQHALNEMEKMEGTCFN